MPNLVLAFAELLGGAIILDAAIKGASIGDVVRGTAAQTPISGSSGSGGATPTGGGALTGSGNLSGYTNPVPGASSSRIDEGGDYTLGPKGFLAPGRSQIVATSGTFFKGGTVVGKFLDGPLTGQFWYVAEGIQPIAGLKVGDQVQAGQQVTTSVASPYNGIVGNIEAGFANYDGTPIATTSGGYSEGQTTAAGVAWDNFVTGLGGVKDRAETAVRGTLSGILGRLEQGAL